MARNQPSPSRSSKSPSGDGLVERLREAVADAAPNLPLPTTREFGKRFRVAGATAYRGLQKLAHEGEIWQHPTSGRYYPATARALLDRPKPVACLIRRLELDSEQYREILEGISLGCGALHRTMLLWHDELLVNHPEPRESPVFASIAQQRTILKDFLARHGEAAGGFVLDHVWHDDVLRAHIQRLQPAVVLFRACGIPDFSNVRVDFRSGALKALTHLLGRGYEKIIPIEPFAGDPAVVEFFAALEQAVDETGCRERLGKSVSAGTDPQRAALIENLQRSKRRTALLCPEDNVSTFLATGLQEANLDCPDRVGLLSVMGTDVVVEARISCLRYDFRALGRLAIEALGSTEPVQQVLEPQLSPGTTT
jgi:DNA-binding LacI/PurR family transcriptional regulator